MTLDAFFEELKALTTKVEAALGVVAPVIEELVPETTPVIEAVEEVGEIIVDVTSTVA